MEPIAFDLNKAVDIGGIWFGPMLGPVAAILWQFLAVPTIVLYLMWIAAATPSNNEPIHLDLSGVFVWIGAIAGLIAAVAFAICAVIFAGFAVTCLVTTVRPLLPALLGGNKRSGSGS